MGAPEDPTDAELLAATASDANAFVAFYRRYEARVLRYMVVRVREPEIAADLAAEVFATVLEHAGDFEQSRGAGDTAAAWLFAIAHNALMTSLRRGRVAAAARVRIGLTTPLALPDHALDTIERLDDGDSGILDLWAELPEDQRVAIGAHVLDERGYHEIAATLECSPLVIRQRVSRGLAKLRSQLESQ